MSDEPDRRLGLDARTADAKATAVARLREGLAGVDATGKGIDPTALAELMRVAAHVDRGGEWHGTKVVPADRGALDAVGASEDAMELLAYARAGAVPERRVALLRIRAVLDDEYLDGDSLTPLDEVLEQLRDIDVAYEASKARAALPGIAGREAREEDVAAAALARRIEGELVAFWDGEGPEPLTAIGSEEVALLAIRLRDVSDRVAEHVAAHLEGNVGPEYAPHRLRMAAAFRVSGDPRLVGAYASLLEMRRQDLACEAARALGRIDDPRALDVLLKGLTVAASPARRAMLASALAAHGVPSALPILRELIALDDVVARDLALEGMAYAATEHDAPGLLRLVGRVAGIASPYLARALARTGDRRAHLALDPEAAATDDVARDAGPLRVCMEVGEDLSPTDLAEARAMAAAIMTLRGQAPGEASMERRSAPPRRRVSLLARWRAFVDLRVGVWLAWFGFTTRARARFDRASKIRPDWASPWIRLAMLARGERDFAAALSFLRSAMIVDREGVEHEPESLSELVRTYLRHADELETKGRLESARSTIEELQKLDLRRAPSALRLEVIRRREESARLIASTNQAALLVSAPRTENA